MKVAIVNDSKMAAEILRRILAELPDFTLAWTAYSGEEALRLCAQSPRRHHFDGPHHARHRWRGDHAAHHAVDAMRHPVVTATTVGNRDKVFEAMGYGALDAVNTPVLGRGQRLDGAEPLMQKLRTVSRLVVSHGARAKPYSLVPFTRKWPILQRSGRCHRRIDRRATGAGGNCFASSSPSSRPLSWWCNT